VTDEVTPDDRARLRHERDDSHYVRRIGDPADEPTTEASDEEPEYRTTRKPAGGRHDRAPRRTQAASAPSPFPAGPTRARAQQTTGRRLRPGAILLASIIVVVIAIGAVAWWSLARAAGHPFGGRPLYVNPDSPAALAEQTASSGPEREAAETIAAQPTGIWLTPERQPAGEVGSYVSSIATASQNALPIFVVYGITDRDCGQEDNAGQSAGGLAPRPYLEWVEEIADGIAGTHAIVILEPDSLALSVECDEPDERVQLVSQALDRLQSTGAAVYLDGGHSNWLPADEMADLLRGAGVDRARGFATNVSNFNTTDDEREYATLLSDELGGTHAVIDTSRNGNGPRGDEWCNPPGRSLGDLPTTIDDPVVDALLWIKPPGESDGRCNGGPTAGDWWPENAVQLAGTG
jgi:endoglucanase